MIHTIRNIGQAEIPIFGYHWMPSAVWRTSRSVRIRGGAEATAFDAADVESVPLTHGREYSDDELWANLEHWIKIITPVAEEAGVRIGLHPCDPPVARIGGVPMILRSFDAFRRLLDIVDSPSNAVEFCQGTFAEMPEAAGEGIYEIIDELARRQRILYVHLRNVSATVPRFHEEFINTGYVDMLRAMRLYHEAGYDGVFVDDHVPVMVGDTKWGHTGRAFANGYIQGLIEAVQRT